MSQFRSQLARVQQKISEAGNSPWLFKKTVIRSGGGILAVVSMAFFAAAIDHWNRTFVHTSGSVRGDWQDGIPIGPLTLAFLYNIGTAVYVFYTGRAVHLAIELVVDFLVWAALVPGLIFSIWGGTFRLWHRATVSSNMVMCNSGTNALSRECFPELYHIGFLELAGILLAIPVW
ncbi:hypothetical protein BGW36DRAFT_392538 [Talaromyces proteolyticus]|uniref:Uncharacterized protein n=1 Tax=Talaromyces proteolyticus TaxID=1131652 RepID=A0AAD4L194_9EURO|nr:uncharacterized protein BGW36DRAFT_392538 [Talaromyces proteolyticus]KAH8704751.1 hypothetical protein BGW36DRAFT_392538 [Talaromyces proteolyticus]